MIGLKIDEMALGSMLNLPSNLHWYSSWFDTEGNLNYFDMIHQITTAETRTNHLTEFGFDSAWIRIHD